MWKNYFGKDAKIIGVDIDPRCKQFEDTGGGDIAIEIGSQEDPNFWAAFREKYPRVDILLDDGGHMMNQQITTFREMFPHVRDGGLYICEDCGTSYFPEYNGGLKREGTFIEFAKNFIDEINAFAGNRKPSHAAPITYDSLNMGGIHFYTYMVVIEKNRIPFMPFELAIGKPGF